MTSIALERFGNVHVLKVKPAVQHIPLQAQVKHVHLDSPQKESAISWLGLVLVIFAHIGLATMLLSHQTQLKPTKPAQPMMVSLIAPPAPEPEIAPVIEPPKPEPKPVVKPKPKKVVQEIKPVETPAPIQIEATTEPVPVEEPTKPVAVEKVAEAPKAPPKIEPVVEEKVEPPRFGVAYLNNPQPDYPAMSRRLGEEGRVLMKVLVSGNGTAKSVDIEESSGSERLDKAAVNAVKKWRFIPARKNNQPLDAFVLVPMKFSLNS